MKINLYTNSYKINSFNGSYAKLKSVKKYVAKDDYVKSKNIGEVSSFSDINDIKTDKPKNIEFVNFSNISEDRKQEYAKKLFDVLAEGSTVKINNDENELEYMEKVGFCKKSNQNNSNDKITLEKQKNWTVLKTLVKDKNDNWVEAQIEKSRVLVDNYSKFYKTDPFQYVLKVNGEEIGNSLVTLGADRKEFRLSSLFLEERVNKKYKGVGSELVKCAVQESRNRGYNGEMTVMASYIPAPFVFYYKNNFKITNGRKFYNAAIDYAAKNDMPINSIIPTLFHTCEMKLDKKGSDAFLRGIRLYEGRKSYDIAEKNIDGVNYIANVVEFGDDEYYIQIIDKDSECNKFKTVAHIKETKNKGDDKYEISLFANDMYIDSKQRAKQQAFLSEMIELFTESPKEPRIMLNA